MSFTALYGPTILAMVLAGFSLLLQLIVADVAAIRAGHKPGHPIPADSGSFIVRATRAHANTNENISAFMLLAAARMLAAANRYWMNILSLAYPGRRAGHIAAYYAGLGIKRSIIFGIGPLALLTVFVMILHGFIGGFFA